MPFPPEPAPANLFNHAGATKGKPAYLRTFIAQLLARPKPALIICGHINLLPLAALARTLTGAPVLLEIYGIDAWQPTSNAVTNALVRSVDAVVSISQVTLDRFLTWSQIPPSCCHLLPNAIHAERYGAAPKPAPLLDRYGLHGKPVIMTFGRLVSKKRSKGFDETLDAIPPLLAEFPDLHYIIAGDGPDRARLEGRVQEQNLEAHVTFTGFVDENEKADHYRLADAYIMPSRGEGFGFVFLEAMACGVPVVASKTDGSREAVLDGKLGALVDPDNPTEIAAAISAALKNQGRTPPHGLAHFSFDNFTRRLHAIVDQVLTTPANPV